MGLELETVKRFLMERWVGSTLYHALTVNELKILELYPGDYSLSGPKIERFKAALEAGAALPPINVYNLSGIHSTRDGNHRVRAWIEFYLSRNQEIPPIPAEIVTPTLRELPRSMRRQLEVIANYFGNGTEGFLRMRVSRETSNESFEQIRVRGHLKTRHCGSGS